MNDGAGAAVGARAKRMRADVGRGLAAKPKTLPPKYFYDARGSSLFDEITRLPEYYLTRTEGALLQTWFPRWAAAARPRSLVELGAGYSEKSRIVLDAMSVHGEAGVYVPVDVSAAALEEAAERLRSEYPGVDVRPVIADIAIGFRLPADLPRPTWFAFLGSTIGNFERPRAVQLLRRVRAAMQPSDRFLMGVDLEKDRDRLEAAYNDARGVTAQFNLNMLRVLNRELGADFHLDAFEHRAVYVPEKARIEMHLVSTREQTVTVPEVGRFRFRKGESIRTEISCKYTREAVADLCAGADLRIEQWKSDRDRLFAIVLAAPAPALD